MSVIELVVAKLTFEGHFAYVWSAWLIGVLLLGGMVLASWLTRRRLLRQIYFDALIDRQQGSELAPRELNNAAADKNNPIQIHQHEEQK